jgi:ADP-L-glycero-D-manno-heptose 6-epimerase
MIVITGAAGFIASNFIEKLNREGYFDLILVDDFSRPQRERNYVYTRYSSLVNREDFPGWLRENHKLVQFVFHLGARTDTAEFDLKLLEHLNTGYSQKVWSICTEFGIPLIYASSAATYGSGELGYSDDHSIIPKLEPLNPYGISKNEFDKWVINQNTSPSFWAGLKFFNVYGPGEYHKGRMASVVYHAYNQIKENGKMKLFRSHKPGFGNGEQKRDFIYVKDICDVMFFFMITRENSGIYNLGTGHAETFLELVTQTFKAMKLDVNIDFMDTPEDIRDKYQYFTEAKMDKLRSAGYVKPFKPLSIGVAEYISEMKP